MFEAPHIEPHISLNFCVEQLQVEFDFLPHEPTGVEDSLCIDTQRNKKLTAQLEEGIK